MKRFFKLGCLVVFLLVAPMLLGLTFHIELAYYVGFGWLVFPIRTFPNVAVEWAAIAVGAGALVLLVLLADSLGRWFYVGNRQLASGPPRRWRFRWALAGVFLVLSVFAAGIAMIVGVHETWWLASSKEPILVRGGARGAAWRAQSINNLKQVGLATYNYHDKFGHLPPGGTFNEYGEMQHSWETMLLPYLECDTIYRAIDQKVPWSDPRNRVAFRTLIPTFLNPGIPREKPTDENEYALSHYAVNSRVLGENSHLRVQDVTDGASNTILAGEVNANFKPWGHPVNWRDPADGLGKSPDGFGSPWKSGVTNMLMMDGSVRAIRNDIDPKVLKALATPAGREKIPDDWKD